MKKEIDLYTKVGKITPFLHFPFVFCLMIFPHECPAAVAQHSWSSLRTISMLHTSNGLVGLLAMLLTDITVAFRIKVQMGMEKMKF